MRKLLTIFALLISTLVSGQVGRTFYFAEDGDDSRTMTQAQSQSTPWKNIAKLNSFFSSLVPTDTIRFKRGDNFTDATFVSTRSGTSAGKIFFGAYGPGSTKPVISALQTLTGWTLHSPGIYKVTVSGLLPDLRLVLVNGRPVGQGVYPNRKVDGTQQYFLTQNGTSTGTNVAGTNGTVTLQQTPDTDSIGAIMVDRNRRWRHDRDTINFVSGNVVNYQINDNNPSVHQDPYGVFFTDGLGTVNAMFEWYSNETSNTFYMYFGNDDPNDYVVEIAKRQRVFDFNNDAYFTVRGLDIRGGNESNIEANYSTNGNITIDSCTITKCGQDAIEMYQSPYFYISNNEIEDALACAVYGRNYGSGGIPGGYVGHNNIRRICQIAGLESDAEKSNRTGISVTQGGQTNIPLSIIEYNSIDSVGYIGIEFKGSNLWIYRNIIKNCTNVRDDGAAIYHFWAQRDTTTSSTTNINRIVEENYIENVIGASQGTGTSSSSGRGLYADEGSKNILWLNNTVNKATGLGTHNNSNNYVTWRGNKFFKTGGADAIRFAGAGLSRNLRFVSNQLIPYTYIWFNRDTTKPSIISAVNDFKAAGYWDSTLYVPSATNHVQISAQANGSSGVKTINTTINFLKTNMGYELNSKQVGVLADSFLLVFDTLTTPKNFQLGAIYKGIDDDIEYTNITVQPFSSRILKYIGPIVNTPVVVTATVTNAIPCNGGVAQVTVSATGGTSPYTGTGTFNGITAGTYTYTVTDSKSAIGSKTISITQPAVITGSVSVSGSAPATVTVSASGGTGPYTYKLDGGSYQGSSTFNSVGSGTHTVTFKDANNCTTTKSFTVNATTAIPALWISATVGTISCNGGNTTVTIGGVSGQAPYSGTGVFTRTAGTYTFSITDAVGQVHDTTISISQPTPIDMSLAASDIAENGGTTTIEVTASGGVGNLEYRLNAGSYQSSNEFTNVSAGSYTITVRDENLCTVSEPITISEPSPLVVSYTAGTINCYGGITTIVVSATGGTPPYTGTGTYSVSAGTYDYDVTDDNSVTGNTGDITITQPAILNAGHSNGTISCFGGTTTVTITGSGGTAPYTGTGTYTGVTAGSKSYTITDANGCTDVESFTIPQPTSLNINGVVTSNGVLFITASGGTGSKTYSINGTTYQGSNSFTGLSAGSYTAYVKDANGCIKTRGFRITSKKKVSYLGSISLR